jgi:hypothetical protein
LLLLKRWKRKELPVVLEVDKPPSGRQSKICGAKPRYQERFKNILLSRKRENLRLRMLASAEEGRVGEETLVVVLDKAECSESAYEKIHAAPAWQRSRQSET